MSRYYNKDEVIEALRVHIAVNHKTQKAFATHIGCTEVFVSYVMKGKKPVPKTWLAIIGYQSKVVYEKVKS